MKTYIKFLVLTYLKSLFFVLVVMTSLVYILNLLSELDFFKELTVDIYFPLFLSLLNSPDMLFEIFPFIILITTQLFFIKLFNNNEIDIFKYTGLKNSKILLILSFSVIFTGILVATFFYNFSSSLKNFYLELKSPYTTDGKYLAVITKNGLWIKDEIDGKTLIINSSKIEQNYLINNFITEFNEDFTKSRNIKSDKIDISSKEWQILNASIYSENKYTDKDLLKLNTSFNYKTIKTLYSNLSALNIYQLYELRKNYKKLNYSITEIDLQLLKLVSYPVYLLLISIFGSIIMLNIKKFDGTTFKISLGLFFAVIIYYVNNFFNVLGSTEKISLLLSVSSPLLILATINIFMLNKLNEK